MGYWGPPTPENYDPAPRPLRHYPAIVDGTQYEYPEIEDEEYFGIGTSNVRGAEPLPNMQPLVGSIGPGARRTNKVQTFRGQWGNANEQSPFERLLAYQKLIALRAPEDPLTGGLCADWLEPDGTLHMQYFDFSDGSQPRRKEVTYRPKPDGGVDVHVFEYSGGKWVDEAFDFERDFNSALVPIMQGIQLVTTAIVSIFATPAVGAAWAAAMQMGVDAAAGRAPPSIGEAFATVGSIGGAANLGGLLASEDGKKLVAGMYKSIGNVVSGEFLGKLTKVASDAVGALPSVDLSAALEGAIPAELLELDTRIAGSSGPNLPGSYSDVFSKAASAFADFAQSGNHDVFYSIRKTVDGMDAGGVGKGQFDLTFAALYGEANAPPDPRFLADQASDPGATLTWRAALSRGKQAMSAPGDPGTMSFRQVIEKSGGALRVDAQKKSAVKTGVGLVVVGTVLAAIAKRFLF